MLYTQYFLFLLLLNIIEENTWVLNIKNEKNKLGQIPIFLKFSLLIVGIGTTDFPESLSCEDQNSNKVL